MATPAFGGSSLGRLVVTIGGNITELNTALDLAEGAVRKNSEKIAAITRQTGRVLTGLGLAVTAGFGATAAAAIKFESAFAGVRKTVEATEEEFSALSQNFRDLSKEIPSTAAELAQIGEIAGQLGVDGVENITEFTEAIAQIEATTNLTRQSAATNFARIAAVMQEPIENIKQMGSSVVDLGNNFETTEAEILNFASRIGGAGKVVGLTTPDIFAIGAAFSSVGVRAERGGTAVQKALILIGTAVEEGGDKLERLAEASGQTTEEFRRGFEEDAAGAFNRFIEGLGESGLKGVEILKELELGDQRLIQSFLSVGGAGGKLAKALDLSNQAFAKGSALADEFAERQKTTASQLAIARNNVVDLAITVGSILLPQINKLLLQLGKITDAIADWAEKHPFLFEGLVKVGVAVGLLALVLGPVLILIGSIVPAMATWAIASDLLGISVIPTLTKNVAGLGVVLLRVLWPIGLIVGAFQLWKIAAEELKDQYAKNPVATLVIDQMQKVKDKILDLVRFIQGNPTARAIAGMFIPGLAIAARELERPAPDEQKVFGGPDSPGLTPEGEVPTLPGIPPTEEIEVQSEEAANTWFDQFRIKTEEFREFMLETFGLMIDETGELSKQFQSGITATWDGLGKAITGTLQTAINSFQVGFSAALSDMILGVKTAEEAFKELGKIMLKAIVDFVAERIAAFVTTQILLPLISSAIVATMKVIGKAAEKPAALVSLATAGANAAPAIAGILGTAATASSIGSLPLAAGGIVDRPTLALIGEGNQKEAVAPFEDFRKMMKEVVGSSPSIQVFIDGEVNIREEEDLERLSEEIGMKVEESIQART